MSILLLAYGLFVQGLQGGFHFDDLVNLAGLNHVETFEAAMQFVTAGIAGPAGRPLSLASFAFQADAWPNQPQQFLLVNILIHLFNGVLVAWFSLLIAKRGDLPHKHLFVLLLTAFWLLHPIQVSPVLFIVQRMTLLAGTFILLGLIFYLLGRAPSQRGIKAWAWIFLAFAMTIPALLSKENGVLLPGFLLILEFFVLGKWSTAVAISLTPSTRWNASQIRTYSLAVWATLLAVVGLYYLYRYWPSFVLTAQAKGTTLPQHAATEVRVVTHYLMQIIIPRAQEFGPFHDDFPVSASWNDPRALAAFAGLLALLLLSWLGRHRLPLVAAGVFMFFWGHGLESSIIPLEPYFEHRNYVPLLGIAIALAALTQYFETYRKLATAGLAGLVLICVLATYQYASLWGDRLMSAHLWHAERPHSARATLHLADFLASQQQWTVMHRLVEKAWRADPEDMNLTFSVLYGLCKTSSEKLDQTTLVALRHSAKEGRFTVKSMETLDHVTELVTSGNCPALAVKDILGVLDTLAENPRYQVHAGTVADLLTIRAKILFAQGKIAESAALLDTAILKVFRLEIALQAAKMFAESGNSAKAASLLEESRYRLPANIWQRKKWLQKIEAAEVAIKRISAGMQITNAKK